MATKERGTLSGVYKITKWLCGGNNNQAAPIEDRSGNILSNEC